MFARLTDDTAGFTAMPARAPEATCGSSLAPQQPAAMQRVAGCHAAAGVAAYIVGQAAIRAERARVGPDAVRTNARGEEASRGYQAE